MISKKLSGFMSKKYFLSLIIVITVFFLILGVRVQAANEILYEPLNCTDGITTYNCGYRPTFQDIWVCGIKKIPGDYVCPAKVTSIHTSECNNAEVWFKENACPNIASDNEENCILADPAADCLGNGIVDKKDGNWNAKDKACVQCSGKQRSKVLADVSQKCYNYTVAGCPFAGVAQWDELLCANDYAGKCDYGCGASFECNHIDDALGAVVAGGVCNNCVFVGPPPLCPNGVLDPGEQCDLGPPVQDAACPGLCQAGCTCPAPPPGPCEPTCTCTCPAECPCGNGTCPPELRGGLVPCGKNCDDPCTKSCECCPCTLCHLFVLFKKIVDFLTLNIIFPLAVLMIVVGGVMFLTVGGDPGRIGSAKKILTATVIGLVIILAAWLIVDTVITFLTPANSPFQSWETIDCPVCGDGNCDSGETPENCPADCGAPPPPPPPVCTPTVPLCNGVCPAGCTVAQDPDCPPCQGGNSCCGIGCNNANDSDCPLPGCPPCIICP
jgi:hypothetical protein